jgi:hypothetical protein
MNLSKKRMERVKHRYAVCPLGMSAVEYEDILALIDAADAYFKQTRQLARVSAAARTAGSDLLFLSEHLRGRMGDYALERMVSVGSNALEAAGLSGKEKKALFAIGCKNEEERHDKMGNRSVRQ